jgi:exonuclease III
LSSQHHKKSFDLWIMSDQVCARWGHMYVGDELVRTGRHFVVVGDFNVAHKDIDVHSKWKVEECYSLGV